VCVCVYLCVYKKMIIYTQRERDTHTQTYHPPKAPHIHNHWWCVCVRFCVCLCVCACVDHEGDSGTGGDVMRPQTDIEKGVPYFGACVCVCVCVCVH
jgi:hypothetical protein